MFRWLYQVYRNKQSIANSQTNWQYFQNNYVHVASVCIKLVTNFKSIENSIINLQKFILEIVNNEIKSLNMSHDIIDNTQTPFNIFFVLLHYHW